MPSQNVYDAGTAGLNLTKVPGGVKGVVTALNTLQGAVILAAGSGITLTPAGQTVTISAAPAGGGVTLQGATPGVPDVGNFNVDGKGIMGTTEVGTITTYPGFAALNVEDPADIGGISVVGNGSGGNNVLYVEQKGDGKQAVNAHYILVTEAVLSNP